MSEKMIENNKVSVIGEVVSEFRFSHEVFGEGFYVVDLAVNRLSDQVDRIPLMRNLRIIQRQTRFSWTAISVRNRFTGKRRWDGRSRIFCWR